MGGAGEENCRLSALRPRPLPDGLAWDSFPTPDPCGGTDAKRKSAAPGTRCLDCSHSFVPSIFAVRNMSRRPFPPRVPFISSNIWLAKGLIICITQKGN